MKSLVKAGFTIIETMLFLGITGLLVAGILVGTGNSINAQRYRDSVSSLQATLQKQYSNVASISNNRDANLSCNSNSALTVTSPGAGTPIGQSDCVIIGKLITNEGKDRLVIQDLIGYPSLVADSATNDLDTFKAYGIKTSSNLSSETYDIEWGSSIVSTDNKYSSNAFSMLILRSPSSGVIRTLIDNSSKFTGANFDEILKQEYLDNSLKLCLNSNGLFTSGGMAVVVAANTTSASGVDIQGEATSGCQ